MSDISLARDAFGKIRRVLSAFEGVDKILAVLENAEQVGRELDQANAQKRASGQSLSDELNTKKAEMQRLQETIKASQVKAQKKAEQIIRDAKAEGEKSLNEATAQRSLLDAELAKVHQEIDEVEQSLALKREESERLDQKVSSAKSYLATLNAAS